MSPRPTRNRESNASVGGSIPGICATPAFTLIRPANLPVPVLLAVPHAGRVYPPGLLARMRHAEIATFRLEDRLVDLVAQAVAKETGAALLVAQAPRAMIDLNRSPEDVDWEMVSGEPGERRARLAAGRRARSGLGLVPRRLPGLGELWKAPLAPAELAERIDGVHRPYHAALAATLEALRDKWGAALLIDVHSMPPLGPKRGNDAAPDYVLGDRFGSSIDGTLMAAAFDHLAAEGHTVAHNRPYAGGYGLDRHAAPGRGLHAMQLEICRTAYLDATLNQPAAGMKSVVGLLAGLVRRMALELARGANLAEAAE